MSFARFCPIASGSSGNCTYAGIGGVNILIDAGISGARIQNSLKALSVEPGGINAIFISHEHSDHIQGAGVLSRRFDVPVYASQKTWSAMDRFNLIGKIAEHNKKVFFHEQPIHITASGSPGDSVSVKPFAGKHDAADPSGFNIFINNYKFSVATDIGAVTDKIRDAVCDSDVLLIESNHDVDMLKNGSYPWQLKRRILGEYGHLSNVSCAQLLTEICSGRTKHVFLGHLSKENNTPLLAFETVNTILQSNKIAGRDFSLRVADRDIPSFCVSFAPERL